MVLNKCICMMRLLLYITLSLVSFIPTLVNDEVFRLHQSFFTNAMEILVTIDEQSRAILSLAQQYQISSMTVAIHCFCKDMAVTTLSVSSCIKIHSKHQLMFQHFKDKPRWTCTALICSEKGPQISSLLKNVYM